MGNPESTLSPVVDPQSFKQAMAQFASGVTIVTTLHEGERYGMTVAAFSSVSLDPPLVLVCIANTATSKDPILRAEKFAVHILGTSQVALGSRFASKKTMAERFEGLECTTAVTGSPILPGCLASIDCRTAHAYVGGDHTIFVGQVVAASAQADGEALLHYRRAFRSLAEAPLTGA